MFSVDVAGEKSIGSNSLDPPILFHPKGILRTIPRCDNFTLL